MRKKIRSSLKTKKILVNIWDDYKDKEEFPEIKHEKTDAYIINRTEIHKDLPCSLQREILHFVRSVLDNINQYVYPHISTSINYSKIKINIRDMSHVEREHIVKILNVLKLKYQGLQLFFCSES